MSLIRKPKRKAKPVKKKKREIEVRQMVLEDLSEVWHVGEKIFTPSYLPFTYRLGTLMNCCPFLMETQSCAWLLKA